MRPASETLHKLDKTHIEHNASGLPLIADIWAEMTFCSEGPDAGIPRRGEVRPSEED